MPKNNIGFDSKKFKKSVAVLDKIGLDDKDINRAASKALIPGVHEVREGIKGFQGEESDDVHISILLSRSVRRKTSRRGYTPGARIVIDGPDIPMGNRDWSAQGVGKLFQKDDTGERSTRSSGASRGTFEGKSVGGGDNYVARFANKARAKMKILFEEASRKLLRDRIKKAING